MIPLEKKSLSLSKFEFPLKLAVVPLNAHEYFVVNNVTAATVGLCTTSRSPSVGVGRL